MICNLPGLFIIWMITTLSLQAQSITKLDPEKFEKKLVEVKNPVLIDVRTPEEYRGGHLEEATLMDYYASDFKSKASKLDRAKPVFVYCASGVRSNSAAEIFKGLGFQVYDLAGGIRSWSQAGKAIAK